MNKELPQDISFAYEYLADRENYHSHKETSAYTIFAVEAAFFTAILTTDWYTKIGNKIYYPKLWVISIIFLLWLLIHRFIRWQLINRRVAALQVGTLITALLDNLKMKNVFEATPPTPGNDTTGKNNSGTYTLDKEKLKMANFIDRWFWPVYRATLISDVDLNDYPYWYQKHYIDFQNKGTGALIGEKFPTLGSIILLMIFIMYVIFIL